MKFVKRASLIILIIGYLLAGINHFREPASYIRIIPHYIPYPKLMNLLAGIFEILFGAMLLFKNTRAVAAWSLCFMLIAFLPVHISMLINAPLQLGTLTVTPLAGLGKISIAAGTYSLGIVVCRAHKEQLRVKLLYKFA